MPSLFPITIEVEEVATGRVLRKLSAMEGVARIHLNLTQDKTKNLAEAENEEEDTVEDNPRPQKAIAYRTDGRLNSRGLHPSQNHAYKTIADILHQTPAHIKILSAAIQRAGIGGPVAINGYIHRMSKLKLIKRTAPGTYRLSERGEKMFFGRQANPNPTLRGSAGGLVVNNFAGARFLILTELSKAGSHTTLNMVRILTEAGFSPKNLSTTGMKMRNEGLIEVRDSRYYITPAGKDAIAVSAMKQVGGDDHSDHNEEGMTDNG